MSAFPEKPDQALPPWRTLLYEFTQDTTLHGMRYVTLETWYTLRRYGHIALLSGVPDFFDRNKILSGGDLSHYQVPHCIRVFFYFVWFVFIHLNFQFYFELCTYCNIFDIYLS